MRLMRAVIPGGAVVAALLLAVSACGGPAPGGGGTYGSLASSGKNVFTSKCAKCHGTNGQGGGGPALWGSGATLAEFGNAKALLDFITKTMPADAAGTLSQQEYQQVLSHILVQGGDVQESQQFDTSTLDKVTLK